MTMTPTDPKEALERLKACAESMACNAANLRADTLPGEANADFYIRTADEHEQWSADLRALLDRTAVCVMCGKPNADPRPWDESEPVCPDCQDRRMPSRGPVRDVAGLECLRPDDLLRRQDVIDMLARLANYEADTALYGEPNNARQREASEAALTNARAAIAFMPPALSPVPPSQGAEKPVAWLHTMHMEGGQTDESLTLTEDHEWGVPGRDFDQDYHITSEPLFTQPQPHPDVSGLVEALGKRAYVTSENHLSGGRVAISFDKLADAADAHEAIARLGR